MLRNRKALSTVVTTLIILVVSALLATIITFYAINIITVIEGYTLNGSEKSSTCHVLNERKLH